MKSADLHLHTLFSDGTYTPGELVSQAAAQDLSAIAVTDHDSLGAIPLAVEAGRDKGIEVLAGVELTAEYQGLEIHILGYLIDCQKKELIERLDFLRKNRIERAYQMVGKLKEMGVALDAGDVFEIAGQGTVGRLHIARAMVRQGCVGSVWEAFQKYIGDKCPAYFAGFKFSPQQAIALIGDSGGIAVLAHPYSLSRDDLIPEFVGWGIKGLEAYYPEHTQSMINSYLEIAQKFNLLVTGGSDCHGQAKPEVKIGSFRVDYGLVEALKAAKGSL